MSEVQLCMSSNSWTWECPHTKDGADHVPLIFLSSAVLVSFLLIWNKQGKLIPMLYLPFNLKGTISSRSTGHAWNRSASFRLIQWLNKVIYYRSCCINEPVIFSHCVLLELAIGHWFHALSVESLLWSWWQPCPTFMFRGTNSTDQNYPVIHILFALFNISWYKQINYDNAHIDPLLRYHSHNLPLYPRPLRSTLPRASGDKISCTIASV